MPASKRGEFYRVLTAAVADMARYGFDSQERLDLWLRQLREAAQHAQVPRALLERQVRDSLGRIFHRQVELEGVLTKHSGVSKFTLQQIKPKLRAELNRRILASASLITLNAETSVQRTLSRFTGWATSIPAGGATATDKGDATKEIRRAIAGQPFEERRVVIDQGHKLVASINDIVATDGGAIACIWHSHWREAGYNYRDTHKHRDGKVYVIRDNWALKNGLMKLAGREYLDQITQPGQEPFCRCYAEYLYTLRDLPPAMVTAKGRTQLQAVKAA